MTILVAGVAGFIGSNLVFDWLAQSDEPVIKLNDLTYAGNLENLALLDSDARHIFEKDNIGDFDLVAKLLTEHLPRLASIGPSLKRQFLFPEMPKVPLGRILLRNKLSPLQNSSERSGQGDALIERVGSGMNVVNERNQRT